jgi:hypothetical protein
MLSMHAVFAQHQAALQKKNAINGQIENLKANKPISQPPFGRTYSEKDVPPWGVDLDKQRTMQEIAHAYLAGESLDRISKRFGMDRSNITKNLHSCGSQWVQSTGADDLNIHFSATLTIPRLLDDDVIRAVEEKLRANRKKGKPSVHTYLLARHIFCAKCGQALTPQSRDRWQYYRHRKNGCPMQGSVRASAIEDPVVSQLAETFGDPGKMEQAMQRAIPDYDEVSKKQKRCQARLAKIAAGRKRLMHQVVKGSLKDDDASEMFEEMNQQEAVVREELDKLNAALADIPDPEAFDLWKEAVARIAAMLGQFTPEDRRKLIDMAFGRRGDGVYVALDSQPYARNKEPAFDLKCSMAPQSP